MAIINETLPHIGSAGAVCIEKSAIDAKSQYKFEGIVWSLVLDCVGGRYNLCHSNIGGVYYCGVGWIEWESIVKYIWEDINKLFVRT